jgi:AcrR family transcriptional regulator
MIVGVQATVSSGQLRKDAMRNRQAILAAARELFADSAEVSMYEVARRAGVGQATLYRNFPDRRALAAEMLGEHVDRLRRVAADCSGHTDAFFVLLRSLVDCVVALTASSSWPARTLTSVRSSSGTGSASRR